MDGVSAVSFDAMPVGAGASPERPAHPSFSPGGATITLIPEEPFDIEAVCESIRRRHTEGKRLASIVVVAEGATPREGTMELLTGETDAFGHVRLGGIGNRIAEQIEAQTGYETRVTILGHVQRGGTPTAFDRVLATRFGVAASAMSDTASPSAMTTHRLIAMFPSSSISVPDRARSITLIARDANAMRPGPAWRRASGSRSRCPTPSPSARNRTAGSPGVRPAGRPRDGSRRPSLCL